MATIGAEPVATAEELDETTHAVPSILFEVPGHLSDEAPPFFADLNLDQVVEAITAGRESYDLRPFFYTPLTTENAVSNRHEVFRDLENPQLWSHVTRFSERLEVMRQQLGQAESLHYPLQRQSWFRDAVETYCDAVTELAVALGHTALSARALVRFRDHLTRYVDGPRFGVLRHEAEEVKAALSAVSYCLQIRGSRVEVSKFEGEPDYSVEVERTFAKFKQGATKDYRSGFRSVAEMDHVEARILDLVAKLYPEAFSALDTFCHRHHDYIEQLVATFDREIQFYLASLDHLRRFSAAGLPLCYPLVSGDPAPEEVQRGFDLALAGRLVPAGSPVVCNDYRLATSETAIVVTGPNQGGKTTFARMFGQLHYLAALALPVPAEAARVSLFDELFTHFERQEVPGNETGKLEDDLLRVKLILDRATRRSIAILNESFTSTTLQDARLLGSAVLRQLLELGSRCVYVTFVDELASFGEGTVSMVSTVAPDNPTIKTFRIARMPANGLAYAAAIAEQHGLTYERLMARRRAVAHQDGAMGTTSDDRPGR